MGNRVLLLRKGLTKGALESENLGKEQGIVAESVSPLRLMGYTALDRSSGVEFPTLLIKVYQMANETSGAPTIFNVSECIEQFCVVCSIVARFAGIARGMHTRSAVESIDL